VPDSAGISPESWTVGMLEAGREPDLALEALRAKRVAQIGMEHLERNRPVVTEIPGNVNGGHAPSAQLALHPVAVDQRRAQPFQSSRHAVPAASISF
jgi:hypothetical protein